MTKHKLNQFDVADFLKNYWQQKPLIIRNGFKDFSNPLSPDELAGLACEDEIESRLIIEQDKQWQLEHGPFDEDRFQTLPEKDWTLLVQSVDHHIPAVAHMRRYFSFIPSWRVDDIMVSYATVGGSVGPHYDNYSVFLVQGAGQRRWQLGPRYDSKSKLIDNKQLRLLKEFETTEEYILNPGDILYVPPLYGHWGTGHDNECMTYSVGFRAPSHAEMLSDYCDERIHQLNEELRFDDAKMDLQNNPGEITAATIEQIQTLLLHQFSDKNAIADWFGRHMTQTKNPDLSDVTDDDDEEILGENWQDDLSDNSLVIRDYASRFAYNESAGQVNFYVNGKIFIDVDPTLAQTLSAEDEFTAQQLLTLAKDPNNKKVLDYLFKHESLYLDDDSL
jgi:50S ribosomal protein L16 3-hydroxylase